MKKKLFALFLMVTALQGAYAVRAHGGWHTVRQSDGTTIEVKQCGDEWLHYFVTRDMAPLMLADNGDFCYADAYGFGMKSSGIVAHEQSRRSADEWRHVRSLADIEAVEPYAAAGRQQAAIRRATLQPTRHIGKYRGLVVLASFKDFDFHSPATVVSDYQAILNEEGYTNNYAIGSLRDYFLSQSHGLFDLTFDIVGPIQVSGGCKEYSTNSLVRTKFAPEVLKQLPTDIDYSQYDWDNDGLIDQVLIIFAGYGANEYFANREEQTGKAKDCIWPLEWEISDKIVRSGKTFRTFSATNELNVRDDQYSGIGTFAHEFSHCLGLPDMYDTHYDQAKTATGGLMDAWELMDGGNYNNHGWVPPNYSAFERAYCGWIEPTVLVNDTTVAGMPALDSENNVAYKIVNTCSNKNFDEYYILENRQKVGWDKYVPGHGLLVWHIDFNLSIWRNNIVNDDLNHLRCMAICADNRPLKYWTDIEAMKNITFPYTDSDGIVHNELTDTSAPASEVFNVNVNDTKFMGKPIRQITEADGLIGFRFFSSNATPVKAIPMPAASSQQPAAYSLGGQRVTTAGSRSGRIVISRSADGTFKKQLK